MTTPYLQWDPVPGATSYNLYRSRFPGVNKINGYRVPDVTSPRVNTGFDNGVAYYMVVTAVNAAGEGPESREVKAVPSEEARPSADGAQAAPADIGAERVELDPEPVGGLSGS